MEMQELALNQESIRRCNNASMFNAGNNIVCDAKATYRKFFDMFSNLDDFTDAQRGYLEDRAASWKDLVEKAYNEELGRRANYVPVSVAGASNYPAQQMNKRVDTLMKRSNEWSDKMQAFLNNTHKQLQDMTPIETVLTEIRAGKWGHGEAFASDDPYVVEKLTAKLDYLVEQQEKMKQTNALYRKETKAGTSKPLALTYYPPYALSNGNAQIRAVRERIEQLQKHKSEQRIQGFSFDGGTVEANYEADRLQIFFDEIPSKETRESLGSRGFHFSRRNGNAWQRQLTRNALSAAKDILRGLYKD